MESTGNIVEDDLISLEHVETWDSDALKEYCQRRGYKVSGTRRELCSRVYFLYNQNAPELENVAAVEASKKRNYADLHNFGSTATDPFKLKAWGNEQEGMSKRPPISIVDIVIFVEKFGHSLSSEALTSYKTGKAYAYFFNDWIQEVFYHPINKTQHSCFLKANCTPSNRLGNEPHKLWVNVVKKTGEIQSAYCSCVAG